MKLAYGASLYLSFWSDWKPHRILNVYPQDMRGYGHRERQWLCSQESLENCELPCLLANSIQVGFAILLCYKSYTHPQSFL